MTFFMKIKVTRNIKIRAFISVGTTIFYFDKRLTVFRSIIKFYLVVQNEKIS